LRDAGALTSYVSFIKQPECHTPWSAHPSLVKAGVSYVVRVANFTAIWVLMMLYRSDAHQLDCVMDVEAEAKPQCIPHELL
jgi:hypothetical protein